MVFKSFPGIEGKVFVPDEDGREKKHSCPDCYVCQHCGDDRCRLCRKETLAKSPCRLPQCPCQGPADAGTHESR